MKGFIILGTILGALSVALGAFGAHALKNILVANQRLDTFELASRYQFYHTLAILGLGLSLGHFQHKLIYIAGYSFLIGILIFSGSLYALALTNWRWLGAITPIGGVALIVAWVLWGLGLYYAQN
ncbi:MAG: DUF423 domain-containing protein [Microscillaceae bacterium]|jgi:uncharacterized membrane protein YgdD (TMEM256/DUF423 family)|nr:DUF423 domain-containing protein [Microscillaceae bacterium]